MIDDQQQSLPLPDLPSLHERHLGLTPAVCEAYSEAARVLLSRHHVPPAELLVTVDETQQQRRANWLAPSERVERAWANLEDAARDGAYSVALAALEVERGFLAVSRAESRTGADYYVGHRKAADLEDALRLEVSGSDQATDVQLRTRLKKKVKQVRKAALGLPAFAGVVGFRALRVLIETVRSD